jgi:DNA replication and repair protein RecF
LAAPTLALQSLTLSHFRSHKRTHLETDGRPIAIYGANGVGKTNILEAISMLSPGRGLRGAKVDELVRSQEAVGWKVSGVLQSLHHVHEVETSFDGIGSRKVLIDEKATSQAALGRIGRVVWLVPVMDRLWVEGADGRRKFLDRLALSFHPAHADASLTYEKAMRERNRMLKDGVRDPSWFGAVEAQMAKSGAVIHANRLAALEMLAASQEQADTAFPAAECTLVHADGIEMPVDEDALAVALSESRPRDFLAGRTLIGPHRADLEAIYTAKGVAARKCSTGEQKALLVSLILANGRALAAEFGAPPIYLLDEVAAHLDADRRAALYDEICALGAQAWMTGTGPELFEDLGDRAMRLDVVETDGVSSVTVV